MTGEIAAILAVDGLANGSIYLLAGLGLVLVFSVTRVIFVPFGDIAAFAALTLGALQAGQRPGTLWLLALLAGLAGAVEAAACLRRGDAGAAGRGLLLYGVLPLAPAAVLLGLGPDRLGPALQIAAALAVAVPMGPLLNRIAFQPIADASVLVLLIVALALHFALAGLGLVCFGAEGYRTRPLLDGMIEVGGVPVSGQVCLMVLAAALLSLLLALFFERSIAGKALRATAVNRVGARLAGIRPGRTAATAYLLAAALAGVAGILIGPIATIYYDSGFIIGLKAFVGAIIGGLVSYPVTAAGAVLVGMLESFASFWSSALKEIVVFSLLIPVLLVRSLASPEAEDEAAEELE